MATMEDRLAKIVKIKTQAMHPKTGEKEARQYAMYAAKLMARHGITQDMVDAAQGVDRGIVERRIPVGDPLRAARATMLSFIATAVHCRTILLRERHTAQRRIDAVIVIGTPGDTERVAELFELLWSQGERGMLSDPVTVPLPWGSGDGELLTGAAFTERVRANWLDGFTRIVARRLSDIEQRQAEEVQHETRAWDAATGHYVDGPSTALVLRAKDQRVNDYFEEKFGHLAKADISEPSPMARGIQEGARAGSRADIGLKGMKR